MTIKHLGGIFGRNPEFSEVNVTDGVTVTKDSGTPLDLNRLTSDGPFIALRKNTSTTVGNIGVNGGNNLVVDGIVANHAGIEFVDTAYYPRVAGANNDGNVDLGGSSRRFRDVYATNGTIQTSDRNEKQDVETLSEAERRVAVACKGLLRKFRWISAVEEKGDEARIHFGIIAQDLADAFTAEGLDAERYGMFIHTAWTDEKTGEERNRMGVRYSELLAFIISAI